MSLPGTATFLRSGWIYNEASNTISHFEVLDYAYMDYYIIFNEGLYYTKSNQVYKFDTSLATQSFTDDVTFSVYPNPSSDMIYFDSTEKIDAIDIYDVTGKLVMSCPNTSQPVNISNLNSGIYFMKVDVNGKIATKKIIKT